MRIANNLMAMNAHRQLVINQGGIAKSIEKLSSGLRINRAGDDAAGLAISEKMRGQIRGLNMAMRNAQDGISLIQTAEGALNETHAILQRMRELAVEAANGTLTDDDRAEIQKEIEQLKSEINRISTDTEFNTKRLLDGSIGQTADYTNNDAEIVAVRAIDPNAEGSYKLTFSSVETKTTNFVSAGGVTQGDVTIENESGADALTTGSYTLEITGGADNATVILRDARGKTIANLTGADFTSTSDDVVLKDAAGNGLITIAKGSYNGLGGTVRFDVTITADIKVQHPDGTTTEYKGVQANANSVMSVAGLELDVKTNLQDESVDIQVTNNGVSFQIGANEGQTTRLAINAMDASSLKVDDIDARTVEGASAAITAIDLAIQKVSGERSKLGAIQNRLEHTISNLGTSAENLQAAESRIRDVDMAKEMMEFTKYQILQQASTAMLAQANLAPQSVLQLLG